MSVRSVNPPDGASAPPLVLAATAYRIPQGQLERFLKSCRARLDTLCARFGYAASSVVLILDGTEEITDVGALAACADVLSYARHRRGLGVARSTALSTALLSGSPWILLADADGQYDADGLAGVVARVWDGDERVGAGSAAIPQRTLVDLPLHGEGTLDRWVAERFEAWCICHAAGRPDLVGNDFQPGVFVLSAAAGAILQGGIVSRQYAWDLEASYRLLASACPVTFPGVASCRQAITSFTAADSGRTARFLADSLGAERVREMLAEFVADPGLRATWGAEALEREAAFVRQALAENP